MVLQFISEAVSAAIIPHQTNPRSNNVTPNQVGFSILILGVGLIIGKLLRMKVRWIQKLFLPSSIVGGFILLAFGPGIFGAIAGGNWAEAGLYTPAMLTTWRALPGLLISVVFATMFLGHNIPSPRKSMKIAGPQVTLGVALGAGQYVIGLLLALLVLIPLLNAPAIAGALVEIGFEGGHGTAAGMRAVFNELGWEAGADMAVGLATIGLVGGVIIGIALINWGTRTGKTELVRNSAQLSLDEQRGLFAKDEHFAAGRLTSRPASVEPFSLHIALVCLAIVLGWLLQRLFLWIEGYTWGNIELYDGRNFELFRFMPLFVFALLGGVIVQRLARVFKLDYLIDPQMMLRVQGFALDFLIISAIASINLGAIGDNIWSFLLLGAAGVAINVALFFILAPRLLGRFWFERGIADFGQSMGVTATGLMLLRIVDPEYKSPAFEAFGLKQLLFEPFYGGGLFTALSVPLIFFFGPIPFLIGQSVIFLAALLIGFKLYGRKAKNEHQERAAGMPAFYNGEMIVPGTGEYATADVEIVDGAVVDREPALV